jgi:hypothetical protein
MGSEHEMTVIRFCTVALLLSAVAAFGAEDGTLALSPAVVMLEGHYGQSTTQTLTLTNGTSRAFSFDLVAQDVVTVKGARTYAEAGSIAGSIAATAVFTPNRVDVPPGGAVTVRMIVTLPPATRQRAVMALFRGTNTFMSGQVPMTASLGMLLTFTLSDRVEMEVAPLSVRPQSASASLAVAQVCRNAGTEPLVARGVMAVLDEKGSLVGKAALAPRRLLPGEQAELGGEFAGELDPGKYSVFLTYDYAGRTLTESAQVTVP